MFEKINVSVGEIVDKLTILEVKMEKIQDQAKLANVHKEYEGLKPVINQPAYQTDEIKQLTTALKKINLELWNIEDALRRKEANKSFDDEFVALARSVYMKNDRRANLKKQINLTTGSDLMEEKSYEEY